jgi:hypothetical protein
MAAVQTAGTLKSTLQATKSVDIPQAARLAALA